MADDTNRNVPRPTRAVLWENALSAAAGKRLMLWQVPAGNINLNNTCDHYQDNRAAYLFNHPRDAYDSGVIAVMFGGGATCMTSPATDGGFIAGQGAIAYNAPGTPTGLEVLGNSGASVVLRWNENTEPDLFGYRLRYQQNGGAISTIDLSRANSTTIVLPNAGIWQISIAALDAMGRASAYSPPVSASTTQSAARVLVPIARNP